MTVHDYNENVKIEIEKVRGDKLYVTIESPNSRVRRFTVLVDEQGLNIKADDLLSILPSSATSVKIDYRD